MTYGDTFGTPGRAGGVEDVGKVVGPTGIWNVVASESARSPQLNAGSAVGATMIIGSRSKTPSRTRVSEAWRAFGLERLVAENHA